jgi:hypothetical protein
MTHQDMQTRHSEEEDSLYTLYRSAGDLEIALHNITRREPSAMLTPLQVTIFNEALRSARQMISHSRALREDIGEVNEDTSAAEAFRMLHVTLVPTLHNALPDDYAAL